MSVCPSEDISNHLTDWALLSGNIANGPEVVKLFWGVWDVPTAQKHIKGVGEPLE